MARGRIREGVESGDQRAGRHRPGVLESGNGSTRKHADGGPETDRASGDSTGGADGGGEPRRAECGQGANSATQQNGDRQKKQAHVSVLDRLVRVWEGCFHSLRLAQDLVGRGAAQDGGTKSRVVQRPGELGEQL